LSEISKHRGPCCGSVEPGPIAQIPTKPPVFQGERGPYQNCDICKTGDYPHNTAMVINMLYIGAGSCKQYYGYGRNGWIQNHLCSALQHFAYEPCGCGEFNPNFNGNVPRAQPVSSSTPKPTHHPLKKPTSRPTAKPSKPSRQMRNLHATPQASQPPIPQPSKQSTTPQPAKQPSAKYPKTLEAHGTDDMKTAKEHTGGAGGLRRLDG
jgi:hypothetical protein